MMDLIYFFTVGITSYFAYAAGYIFSSGVLITLNSASYTLSFITQGWAIMRDLANMGFILIIVYIAFTIIFQAETSGTMKSLAAVVIMALLINFSFFFSRLVIDGGNILAIQFYNAIDVTSKTTNIAALIKVGSTQMKDLTAMIMQATGVQTMLGSNTFGTAFSAGNSWGSTFITFLFIYCIVAIALMVLGATFLVVGIKFLLRMVALWFVIIMAPLAFVARALANNAKAVGYFNQWFGLLIKNAFYPAFFLAMFWLINLFASDMGSGSGALVQSTMAVLANAGSGSVPNASLIGTTAANVGVKMAIIIGMLYYALKLSDFASGQGSAMTSQALGWTGRTIAGAPLRGAFGMTGWAGRGTIGRAGAWVAERPGLINSAAANNVFARGALSTAKTLSKKTFDPRALSSVATTADKIGINAGKAAPGGYKDLFDARVKRRVEAPGKYKLSAAAVASAQQSEMDKFVASLTPEKRTELQAKKDAYDKAYKAREAAAQAYQDNPEKDDNKKALGVAKEQESAAKKALNGQMSGFNDRMKVVSGSQNAENYAKAIESRNWKNAWGVANGGMPFMIPAADKEAARQIRAKKNDTERLFDIVDLSLQRHPAAPGTPPAPNPTPDQTPPPPGPTPTPPPTPGPTPTPTPNPAPTSSPAPAPAPTPTAARADLGASSDHIAQALKDMTAAQAKSATMEKEHHDIQLATIKGIETHSKQQADLAAKTLATLKESTTAAKENATMSKGIFELLRKQSEAQAVQTEKQAATPTPTTHFTVSTTPTTSTTPAFTQQQIGYDWQEKTNLTIIPAGVPFETRVVNGKTEIRLTPKL